MPLPETKQDLLRKLESAYSGLDNMLEGIEPAQVRLRELEGEVSCCDLIAYQIGWGRLLLSWELTEAGGELATLPAAGFRWNQLGELAEAIYAEYADFDLPELRAEFFEVYQALYLWIEGLEERDLFQFRRRQWIGEKWTMVKWIQVNTIAPYTSARTKLKKWKAGARVLPSSERRTSVRRRKA
jgi:hypothetical protein